MKAAWPAADGTGTPDTLLTLGPNEVLVPRSIAPDGRHVLLERGTLERGSIARTADLVVAVLVQPTPFLFYDVHRDGSHFAMTVSPVFEPQQLVLVVNWLDEFNRKLEEGR